LGTLRTKPETMKIFAACPPVSSNAGFY